MSEQTPEEPRTDPFARARDDEEPGAHSGGESQARDRVVPGTASAREGYETQGGTAHGETLTGVGSTEGESGVEPSDEDDVADASAVEQRSRDEQD
jgi:hypothetical protein